MSGVTSSIAAAALGLLLPVLPLPPFLRGPIEGCCHVTPRTHFPLGDRRCGLRLMLQLPLVVRPVQRVSALDYRLHLPLGSLKLFCARPLYDGGIGGRCSCSIIFFGAVIITVTITL